MRVRVDRAWSFLGAALLLASCRADPDPWAELPTPDHVGERVVIAIDSVDRICAGTLATIDAEVERIELELELDATDESYRVWILEPERTSSICGTDATSCSNVDHGVVVAADNFTVERQTAPALTPLLLARAGIEVHPYFAAGLAGAMGWPTCASVWIVPDELGYYIDDVQQNPDARVLASALVGWLLSEYGAAIVFDFLHLLPLDAWSYEVEVLYAAYFGVPIEHDTADHANSVSWDWNMHCFAPEPEPVGARRVALRANLDCDSPRVHTDFDTPGFGFVEWTLAPVQSGLHVLHGELPEGSRLEITRCQCDEFRPPFESFDPDGEDLSNYSYQLRWHGPLDAGLELDVEIETPCSVAEQDCPAGSKCLDSSLPCQPLARDPIEVGEPCTVELDGLDPCVAGAHCFGEPDDQGVVSGRCVLPCDALGTCDGDQRCAVWHGVCGPACEDPINNDCADPDLACTWSLEQTVCLPTSSKSTFEPCEQLCAPGLVCGFAVSEACPGSCCLPVCEVALGGADCPIEAPLCFAFGLDDPTFGYCVN